MTKPGAAATLAKRASTKVGVATIAFTSKDILTSVSNKQYKGAALDLASGIAGVLIGAGIGVGVTILISAGAPVLLAGALGFGINIFISGKMDTFINKRKEELYGS